MTRRGQAEQRALRARHLIDALEVIADNIQERNHQTIRELGDLRVSLLHPELGPVKVPARMPIGREGDPND